MVGSVHEMRLISRLSTLIVDNDVNVSTYNFIDIKFIEDAVYLQGWKLLVQMFQLCISDLKFAFSYHVFKSPS